MSDVQIFACFPLRSSGKCHYCTRRATRKCSFIVEGTDGDGREAAGTCDRLVCGQCSRERSGFVCCNFHALKKTLDKVVAEL